MVRAGKVRDWKSSPEPSFRVITAITLCLHQENYVHGIDGTHLPLARASRSFLSSFTIIFETYQWASYSAMLVFIKLRVIRLRLRGYNAEGEQRKYEIKNGI